MYVLCILINNSDPACIDNGESRYHGLSGVSFWEVNVSWDGFRVD